MDDRLDQLRQGGLHRRRHDGSGLATPQGTTRDAVTTVRTLWASILVDCTNPLKPDRSGLPITRGTSGAEKLAESTQSGRAVKAFKSTGAGNMAGSESGYGNHCVAAKVAGKDDAKTAVGELAEALGFEPVGVGPLSQTRHLESLVMLWVSLD